MEKLGRGAAIFATGVSLVFGCSAENSTDNPADGVGTTGNASATMTATTSPGATTAAGSTAQTSSASATVTTGSASGSTTSTTGGAATATTGADGAGGTSSTTTTTDGGADNTTGGTGGTGGTTSTTGGTGGPLDNYNPDFVEFVGEDCELPEPTAASSQTLPDPFKMPDGSRMSSISQWACQRAWLKKNIEAFVHGAKPGTPEVVTGSVSANGVQIHVEEGGASADFSIPIKLPPGAAGAPVPAMFKADGSGVPDNFLADEGVASMAYSHSDAEAAYNKIYGGSGVDLQIKWAWAVSRAIDVLVAERDAGNNNIIDPTALGTTGCSYAGKSAFTVGAFDERIALGIPQESGTGGLGSYRVVGDNDLGPNGGENPEQVSEACGHDWFTGQLCSGNADSIPADAHFMVAMYAPRGFTTLDNNRIGHLGPVAQFAALSAGAEVFKALGVESHVGYHGGNDDDPHNHCTFYPSQEETARKAIRGFLTKTEPPANFMEPKLKNQNDQPVDFQLGNYIDWDTPTLD